MHLFSTHVCPFRQSLSSIHPASLQALAIHSCPILHSESSLQFVHLPSTLHTCPFGQSALLEHSGGEIHSPSTHHYVQKVKEKRKKHFLAVAGLEPTPPCSRGELTGALDH